MAQNTAGARSPSWNPYTVNDGKTGYMEVLFPWQGPGQGLFYIDENGNVTATSFKGQQSAGAINVTDAPYNADPTGTNDATTAFQTALNQIITNGGGSLYVPAGTYLLGSALTYTSPKPLRITGDGPGASVILCNSTSSNITYLTVTGNGKFRMDNLSWNNNANSPAFSDTNIGISLNSITWASFNNVVMQAAASANRVNQAIVISECTNVDIDACDIRAYVNPLYITGVSATPTKVVAVRSSALSANSGSLVATAAGILADWLQTLHLSEVVINGGDRGIYWTGGTGTNPAFGFFYDVEVNNTAISGMDFESGSEIWMTDCWISVASPSGTEHGLIFGSSFVGAAYLTKVTLQGWSGHSIYAQGGTGFDFTSCIIGAGVKATANFYDEINIAAAVAHLGIHSCHINTDPAYGVGSTKARSAVYINSGAAEVILTGNNAAGDSNYGTAALQDFSGNAVRRANIGLGMADSVAGAGATVTQTSYTALSGTVTTADNEATVGAVFKITAAGHGIEATGSAVNLSLRYTFNGGGLGAFTAGTNPGAGATFNWKYEGYLVILTTGSGGTANLYDQFTWNGVTTQHTNLAVSLNTQTNGLLGLYAEWASATGSPTLTCDVFTIERVQNIPAS